MGRPIAGHLVAAGHHVIGFDPSPFAQDEARAIGVEVIDDPLSLECPVVLTSLPDTPQVEEAYLGGLFDQIEPGSLCLDLSTIDVDVSRAIGEKARDSGHDFLDCPLSGTSVHAVAGTLAVMVGGPADAVQRARPLLEVFSSSVHHLGPNGAGLEMKLITNRLLTAHLVSLAEAILEMEQAKLDTGTCLEILRGGAVPKLLDYKAGPMALRDHTPLFTVDLMAKDLGLAELRRSAGAVGATAAAALLRAQEQGWGPSDISAVIEVLETGG
jgi:2-hydroxy-3-oxopropionate reductase